MFIKFHMIRWKNLLSTGNEWITIPLSSDPTTLIIGKNGHGKSQFLDAITFVLFNKAFRKINKPQLVNSINKKGTMVEIAFTDGRHEYVVRRGIKPDTFEIYKDKVIIPEDSAVGDYQTFLETHILRMDYKTFTQITIIGKATYVPFMQLKPAERRTIVENLLESQIYGDMQELAKDDLRKFTANHKDLMNSTEILNVKIQGIERLIREKNEGNENHIRDIENNNKSLLDKISSLENDKKSDQVELDGYRTKVEEYKNSKITPEQFEEAKSNLIRDIASAEADIRNAQNSIKKIDMTICPSCGQNMDETHKNKIISESEDIISKSKERIDLFRERLDKVETTLSGYNVVVNKAKEVFTRINSYKRDIEFYNKSIEENNSRIEKIRNTKHEVDEEELVKFKEELENVRIDIDKNSEEIEITKKCIKLLDDGGIKAFIVDKYIPIINERINYYLERMNQFIQFELDAKFNETIKARYRDTYSYESFSEGEKLRINLAILLAWIHISKMRNSVATNIIVFDEVLDGSMDDEGIMDFLSVIREVENSNIFLISHKTEVIEGISNTYRAKKVNNFTEMERL